MGESGTSEKGATPPAALDGVPPTTGQAPLGAAHPAPAGRAGLPKFPKHST